MQLPSTCGCLSERWATFRVRQNPPPPALLSSRPDTSGDSVGGTVVTLHVEPHPLRAFAPSASGAADAIEKRNIRAPYAHSQSAFLGTGFSAAAACGHIATAQALANIRQRSFEVTDNSNSAANDCDIVKTGVAAGLTAMDVPA